jgi:hypothetical protein
VSYVRKATVAELEAKLVSAERYSEDAWKAQRRALDAMNTAIQQRDEASAQLSKAEGDLAAERAKGLEFEAMRLDRDSFERLASEKIAEIAMLRTKLSYFGVC